MSQSIPLRHSAFIIAILAVVQFIIHVSLLTKGMEYAVVSLIVDDTYYYLQTAWNAKMLGFVTFDGLHATNGVQLLWFVIIFLLAMLAKTKAALLFITLAVSFLLNELCYLIILKIGAVLKQPILALFMASLWALQSLPFRIYSMGMENSLHALERFPRIPLADRPTPLEYLLLPGMRTRWAASFVSEDFIKSGAQLRMSKSPQY